MTTEIKPYNGNGNGALATVHPMDIDTIELKSALDRRATNRDLVMGWIKEGLVENTDYGCIHTAGKNRCAYAAQYRANDCPNPAHWSKACLFKPGAEKIAGMLGLRVEYPSLVEYERMVLEGKTITHVVLRCLLVGPNGSVVAEGVGARSLQKDDGDLNKSLKMAEKSGLIDATLRVAGISSIFMQDLEDSTDGDTQNLGQSTPTGPHDYRTPRAQAGTGTTPPPAPPVPTVPASAEEVSEVVALSAEAGVTSARLAAWIFASTKGRTSVPNELTENEVKRLTNKLREKIASKPSPRVIEGEIIPEGYRGVESIDHP